MSSVTFPNGQAFTSTALTFLQMNVLMQALTTQMLGVNTANPRFNDFVRLDWPTGGQPGWKITEDVCFLRNVVVDDPYNRIRDKVSTVNDGITNTETWTYTRTWRTSFTVVGPNSLDNARLIKSALFLEFSLDSLALSNLFIVPDIADPIRSPELLNGQWWERAELEVRFYEGITEKILTPSIASVDIVLLTESGQFEQFDIERPPMPTMQFLPCTGTTPGNTYVVTGTVVQVFLNAGVLRPTIDPTMPLDYSVSGGIITLTFTTQVGDTVYALVSA